MAGQQTKQRHTYSFTILTSNGSTGLVHTLTLLKRERKYGG